MKSRIIISAMLLTTLLASCDNMFEPKEEGMVDDEQMWTIPEMVRGILYDSYNSIPNRPDTYNNNFLDVATDNALTNSFEAGIYRMALGQYTASNCPLSVWSSVYEQFQNLNQFLEKGLTEKTQFASDPDEDASIKKSLKAEALFLRGWWGAYLLQYHGGRTADGQALGYPITTEFIDPEESGADTWMKRNTYEECVGQICEDLDSAALYLPAAASGDYVGRATSLMAEFVKARVLFLAACPAYQPQDIVILNNGYDYTVVDASAYKQKWERAAIQAAKVIDLSGNTDYTALKLTDLADLGDNAATPKHFVFRYYYEANNLETRHFPPFYYGKCLSVPSQNLVDAYPMKANGFPITAPESGYDSKDPYNGRDDRLAFTVYHHGDKFGNSDSVIDVTPGGKDSESFMSNGQSGSRSGYYLRKHLSSKANLLEPLATSKSKHFYPSMRIAEMFLDLAEASNEAWGPEVKGTDKEGNPLKWSAYDIMRTIRKKSGGIVNDEYIETVKSDKESFTSLILNERRLELAFENVRFWDLRRRLLPLDETVKGMKVEKDSEGNLIYTVKEVEKRDLNDVRYYYLPVPYNETLKNPNMINNIGY
ncbi:MAG: RagB/SusD family nutrient uptake outer membrane protein [Candidatus Cryptobacteroides sp.]